MNEAKTKKEKDEVQITVSLACEKKLQECLETINNGFDLARVTRKHLAIFLIERSIKDFDEDDVQAVRNSSLSDVVLLEKALKDARESGLVPEELREILWKSHSLAQSPKRTKKSRQPMYSKAIHTESEAA